MAAALLAFPSRKARRGRRRVCVGRGNCSMRCVAGWMLAPPARGVARHGPIQWSGGALLPDPPLFTEILRRYGMKRMRGSYSAVSGPGAARYDGDGGDRK